MLGEARGGEGLPESMSELVGAVELRRGIRSAWGRAKAGRQRGKEEETQASIRAWSGGWVIVPLIEN